MSTTTMKTRVTSFAPQFLVDDLERSIAYYQKIGFSFDEPWDGFYAIGHLDGLEVHLKEAPKNQTERQWQRDDPVHRSGTGTHVLRTVRRQRRNDHQAARGHGVGHQGLLCRGPRRLHHLLRWPPDSRLTSGCTRRPSKECWSGRG